MNLGSQFDHSSMGILMVKNIKHLLVNLFMTLESLKTETSKTTTKNIAVSPMIFPSNDAKIEVGA